MQALDPAGIYTDAEVIAALTAKSGTRTMLYRYDLLSEQNDYLGPIDWVMGGSVSNNSLADLKRTARFTIVDRGNINYLKQRIRPRAILMMPDGGFVQWSLGVFLLSTPKRSADEVGVIVRDVEAYDQLVVLRDDKTADRYSVASGTAYTSAIATILSGLAVNITPSALTLPAAMEWEPGTSRLRILNDLLDAINYESAWFDELGRCVCRPYVSPAIRTSEYTYSDATASVRTGIAEQTFDLFDVPNKWVLVKSEADQATPLIGTYTNTNPASPTSTVSRGRTIVDYRTEEDAADQATIDAKAARLGFESSQIYEAVSFDTAAMPMHSNADVLTLEIPSLGVSAKYSEQSWELPLVTGARMRHTVRRVVTV